MDFQGIFPINIHKGVNPCSNMGGDNIRVKYTSLVRDVSRGAKHRVLLGRWGGGRENVLNGAIWCVLVYILIRFCL